MVGFLEGLGNGLDAWGRAIPSGTGGGLAAGLRGFSAGRKARRDVEAEQLISQAIQEGKGVEDIARAVAPQNPEWAFKALQEQANKNKLTGGFGTVLDASNLPKEEKERLMESWLNYQARNPNAVYDIEYNKVRGGKEGAAPYLEPAESAKAIGKERGEAQVKREEEEKTQRDTLQYMKNTRERLFGDDGIIKKANVGHDSPPLRGLVQRKTPTFLINKEAQMARQEIQNILGGLRLDQMQYLKGAISDKEQEFLSNIVSGDVTKYTPAEIEGTFNAIMRKLDMSISDGQRDGKIGDRIPEGSVAENDSGQRIIFRGGAWQQM